VRACSFCDSSLAGDRTERVETAQTRANESLGAATSASQEHVLLDASSDATWRGELNQRLQAYRTKRRKVAPNLAQSALPFDEPEEIQPAEASVAVAENPSAIADDDFSFTIAIGRNAATREQPRMLIDLSQSPVADSGSAQETSTDASAEQNGLYPVASIEERRLAGFIDAGCLLFAYGGFLALFGSLGGEFTLSKLSAAVCAVTFVFVYLQYFALFTVFGGTTPGMMFRGLHVASFSGEPPAPRQMLWRSVGYMLSAGTFFMGFLWAMWDEDGLTWHDRLSQTYLCPAPSLADLDNTRVAHSR